MADKKETQAAEQEEKVKITLFLDSEHYVAPLFVGVNGKSYLIKRGVEVEIPKPVHEAILNSEEQKRVAAKVSEESQNIEMIG